MSNIESSSFSIEEAPLNSLRDSIITYSTDLGSSVDDSLTTRTEPTTTDGGEKRLPKPPVQDPISRFYRKKRFWAICVAITVVLAAIFIPLFFLVIIPSVAQHTIDKANLVFTSINITEPRDEGFNTDILGSSDHGGNFDATLTFNGPVSILYENKLLGTVASLEPLRLVKGQGTVKATNQKFKIANFTLFKQFTKASMLGSSFEWTIQGTVNIRSLGISTNNLKLNKVITIPGVGGFSNAKLNSLNVGLNPDQTLRLEMETSMNNPSPLGMEIGKLFLQVQYLETVLANVTSSDFTLVSGENALSLTGSAKFPTNDVDKLNMVKLIEAYLTNQPVNTTAKGLYAILRDGSSAKWLNDTIQDLTLQTQVGNQPKAPQLVTKIDFGQSNLVFTPNTSYSPTYSVKGANSNFVSPFDIEMEIETLQQNISINFKGRPMVEIDSPVIPATNTNTTITFDMPNTPMKVFDDAHDLFSEFLETLTTNSVVDVEITGVTSIKAKTPMGEFPINGLPINLPLQLPGFNQFNSKSAAPKISDPTLINGNASEVVFGVVMTMNNPTQGSVSIGLIQFNLFFHDQSVGTIVIDNLSVVPGSNPLNIKVTLFNPLTNPLLLNYFSGNETIVNIRGFDGSTNIDSFKKTFQDINLQFPLPPLTSATSQAAQGIISNLSELRSQ